MLSDPTLRNIELTGQFLHAYHNIFHHFVSMLAPPWPLDPLAHLQTWHSKCPEKTGRRKKSSQCDYIHRANIIIFITFRHVWLHRGWKHIIIIKTNPPEECCELHVFSYLSYRLSRQTWVMGDSALNPNIGNWQTASQSTDVIKASFRLVFSDDGSNWLVWVTAKCIVGTVVSAASTKS